MDPWSSNEWVEPADRTPSIKPELDLHLQPSHEHTTFPSSQHPWPLPDLSLPSWDSPSPPKSNSPVPGTSPLGGPGTPVTQSDSGQKLDQITKSIQTSTIHTHPTSPANSFRTAGSVGSDQWAESNLSPPNEAIMQSHQFTSKLAPADNASSTALAPTPVDLSHPTSDPDDVRWESFNQPEITPISSTISFQPDPTANFSTESPAQSGWDGETNLSGWDSGVAVIDHSLSSFDTSLHFPSQDGEDIVSNRIDKRCSSPHLSENLSNYQENGLEPAWDPSESHHVYQSHQLADQQLSPNESPEKHQESLSSRQVAPNSNLSSTLNCAGKLAGICAETLQGQLSDSSATQSRHPFPNSSTSDVFQTAMSMTAQVAANVLKSANKPRRFFGNAGTSSSASQHSSIQSASPESLPSAPDKITWGDFASLQAPVSNSTASSETPTQQQSEQKPRASFFSLWTSKPSPLSQTSESKAQDGSSMFVQGTLGSSPLPPQNSSHQSRDSVSSTSTSSTVWPAPWPASPDAAQSPNTSTMSRLFGRFGSRSASIGALSADDQSAFTTPSTELDANEAQILDFFKTVPIEPQTLHEDDLPLGKIVPQHKRNGKAQKINPSLDVFDLVSDKQVSPKLRASVGSRQPASSQLSSSPAGPDPFDFINSGKPNKQRYFSSEYATSSGSGAPWSRLDSSPSSSSHPKDQLKRSGLAVGGQTTPGDDLDDIFSAFQGPTTSAPSQDARNSSTGIFKESGQVSNRLSTPNISSMRGIPRPLMNNSLTSQTATLVRMASNSPKPILGQTSDRIETGSTKIPILPPPPCSSGSAVTNSRPLVSPPPNKVPIVPRPAFSSGGRISSPTPLITAPQNNVNPAAQKASSNYSHPIPPSQNPDQLVPFSTPLVPHQTFSAATNTQQNPNRPIQTGHSLSKADLSFFDSLL